MILAFVMIPLVSFAKTTISDSDLNAITAEAGVSIVFNNLTISSLSLSKISWGDSNGIPNSTYTTGYTNAGWLGATDIAMTGNLIDRYSGNMTVDVGTSGTQTRVQIALPNEITLGGTAGMNIVATLRLGDTKYLDNGTNAPLLTTIDIEHFKIFVYGTVTVFAH